MDWLTELDFSFSRKFLDDKLRINLDFNKKLNRGFFGKIDYENGNAVVESNSSRQSIQFRLVYSFDSKLGEKINNRETSREEENQIRDKTS